MKHSQTNRYNCNSEYIWEYQRKKQDWSWRE
jgi:hypothetical protein